MTNMCSTSPYGKAEQPNLPFTTPTARNWFTPMENVWFAWHGTADAMYAWAQAESTTPTTHVQLVAEQDCATSAMAEADYSHHPPFLPQRSVAIVAEIRVATHVVTLADIQVDMWAEALRRAAPQAKPDAHAQAATVQVKAQMK